MLTNTLHNQRIVGIAAAVPENELGVDNLASLFGQSDAEKVVKSTGVANRRVASSQCCSSDLSLAAAIRLMAELDWDPASIQALIFVSQTPDYRLPATACVLHARLGLSKNCAAFDVNLGCSGYIYGLWMAAQFIQASSFHRVLLLAGDTITHYLSDKDRSTFPIFGDAGTATALEFASGCKMHFSLATDGTGANNIIVKAGCSRLPNKGRSDLQGDQGNGNLRSENELFMNGAEVFGFTLREVPPLIESILNHAGWNRGSVDQFVFHQANRFMLEYLASKMKLPMEKVPLSLGDYGNTSSASIPLTISACLREKLSKPASQKVILAGFGVGWSWGACAAEMGSLVLPPILEVAQ